MSSLNSDINQKHNIWKESTLTYLTFLTGEKAALEKPEEQIEEMTEEQHAGEVNGAGVLDKLINGVSVWP